MDRVRSNGTKTKWLHCISRLIYFFSPIPLFPQQMLFKRIKKVKDRGTDGQGEVTSVLLSHFRVLLGSLESQEPKARG